MTEKEIWTAFTEKNPVYKDKRYDAWCFGGGVECANELAKLVVEHTKTATTSAFELYELENSPLPPVGGLNIILDANDHAICITETTKVYVCRYNEVSEEHAFLEGEGDRSLEYWKDVHKTFFTSVMHEIDKSFDDEMLVVCEEFLVIHK